ncbi:oligogalacturonate-specific porin KdgM family protein [Jinshanibacter sp. LJY008]|uniref:Oligogalacturonate-specific porin KdgM family protein n=1 Tax=Limnobaculum eriocheiris TaxID=2897391 RepID=A0A9X1MVJ6_9GAMM|nr:oligogalacturonate-specific porin KdgM family protein [Limnobaculum eriocheiris]MCD1125323.1 oligogalacturonate-specific porin KdgM family protein [Limnobaculum eriocheiris]
MNNLIRFIAISACLLTSSLVMANDYKTTVEYRHDYRDGVKKHGDRFKVFLDTGQNIGFELDARYNNKDDKVYDSMTMNGSEVMAFYYDKLNANTTWLAGTSLDFTSDGLVYIPFVRLNYQFDNGIRLQGRYKWKIWDYDMVGLNGSTYCSKIQQFDTFLGYKFSDWDVRYQFDLFREMESNGLPLYNNNKWDYQHNVVLTYSINKNWRPFVEVGNIKEKRFTSERQTRYRVGIKYTW